MGRTCLTAVWQGHLARTQRLCSRPSVAQTRVWAVQPQAALQVPEENTRKGERVWLSWGSNRTTAKEATFVCTVGTWGSLLLLLLTGNSLCGTQHSLFLPSAFEPLTCSTSCFPRRSLLMTCLLFHCVAGTGVSSSVQIWWHFHLSLIKANKKLCQIIRGFFSVDVFFFSVDVLKYLTAKVLNSIAEFAWTLENEGSLRFSY